MNTTPVYTANQVNNRLTRVRDNLRYEIDRARRDAIAQANRAAEERARQAKMEMQKRLNDAIASQNSYIRKLDQEQRERLNQITNQIYDDLSRNVSRLEVRIDRTAEVLRKELSDLGKWASGRFATQQREIESISKSVQSLFDHIAVGQNKSIEAVKATRALYEEAIRLVDMEKFMPVETRKIILNLGQIEEDPQASLNQARMTYIDIIIAREEALK